LALEFVEYEVLCAKNPVLDGIANLAKYTISLRDG